MIDLAAGLIGKRDIEVVTTGIRPGEKLHESLISEEESHRAFSRDPYYVIAPILPELRRPENEGPFLEKEYSSKNDVMSLETLTNLLVERGLMVDENQLEYAGEFLR
jgi:FlaA1/EpsC-like NDP-sugar epimerase